MARRLPTRQGEEPVFDSPEYLDATVGNTEWVPLNESIWRGIVGFSFLSRVTIPQLIGETGLGTIFLRPVKPLSYLWTVFYRDHRSIDGDVYKNKIATTFFPRTKVKKKDGSEEEVIEPLQLIRLDAQILNRKLPFLVVNATAQFDTDNEGDLPLSQRIFEFTPFYIGGDGVGWKQIKDKDLDREYFPMDLATVASISGAVADSAEEFKFTSLNRAGIWFAEANQGYLMAGLGAENEFVLLTDGGHTENLGVFPLVRRRCEQIYVVDAEWESTFNEKYNWSFTFEGYHILKHALTCELGANMSVDEIDKAFEPFTASLPACKGKGEKSEMRTVDISWENLPRVQLQKPVMDKGWADLHAISGRDGSFKSNLIYIKLVANRGWLEAKDARAEQCYGKTVVDWFKKSKENKWQFRWAFPFLVWGDKDPTFPHVSTFDLDWTKEQFRAYAELGYMNFMNYHKGKKECM